MFLSSDNEFLEDLIAKPEDAEYDERNEDRGAMNMKLQRDLGEREEEVYERLIGSTWLDMSGTKILLQGSYDDANALWFIRFSAVLLALTGYQRSGKGVGTELTEQEILELELEERRRNEAKRRRLLGDGAFAVRLMKASQALGPLAFALTNTQRNESATVAGFSL